MKYTIEQLNYIVPAISIGFLFIITSINVYFRIRRRFSVTVNCWFCNENSKVPYDDLNKFTCAKCEQYNGFTEDGDYNCDIPAQRSSKLNKCMVAAPSLNGSICGRLTPQNGLCEPCNRNQELKVQQLASFEPENEAYFDEEIEEYRKKLEQAYRLCPRCERHLKRTLNKVKSNILGSKLKQIGAKGLQALNLSWNQKANKVTVQNKRLTFARISLTSLIVISLLQSLAITNQISITKSKLDTVFNAGLTTSILTILSYISAVKIMCFQLIEYVITLPCLSSAVTGVQMLVKYTYTFTTGDFWQLFNTDVFNFVETTEEEVAVASSTFTTNVCGCFLSVFILFLFGLECGPVLSLLIWSLGMIMPAIIHDTHDVRQILILEVIQLSLVWLSVTLSVINFFILPKKHVQKECDKNASFHRINSEMNSDVSDDSDIDSELNISARSNISSVSRRSMWSEAKVLNSTISSKAPSVCSSMRQRTYGASTQSVVSLKPSEFNTSFGSERSYNKSSHMDLTRDKLNASHRSLLMSQSQDIFSRAPSAASMSFRSLNKTFTNDHALRSASRNSFYDVPNDFESCITNMSISGMGDKQTNMRRASQAFGSTDHFEDSLRQRKSVLSPSRLSLNDSHHSVNQSSWLAGGYWNSTSPQKKTMHYPPDFQTEQQVAARDAFPMISRTSSKSSGFESRENSLCDDAEVDRTFLFSEPSSLMQSARAHSDLIRPMPQKAMSFCNGMSRNNSIQAGPFTTTPTVDMFARSNGEIDKSPPHLSNMSRTFSQFSLQQPMQRPSHSQDYNNTFNSGASMQSLTTNPNVSKLNRINTELPMRSYARGSLIKLNEHVSMDH